MILMVHSNKMMINLGHKDFSFHKTEHVEHFLNLVLYRTDGERLLDQPVYVTAIFFLKDKVTPVNIFIVSQHSNESSHIQ